MSKEWLRQMPFFLQQGSKKTWIERNGELVWGAIALVFLIFVLAMIIHGFFLLSGVGAIAYVWSCYRFIRFQKAQGINGVPTGANADGDRSPGPELGGFGGGDA